MTINQLRRTLLWLMLCPGMGIAFRAPAQTNDSSPPVTLEQISRAMGKADTVFTRFTQERHLSIFQEPLKSEGFLCYRKPGSIRWETTQPYQSILVSDGSGVAQFEWVNDHWKKLDLGLADAMQNVIEQIAGVMEGRYAQDPRSYSASVTNSAEGPVVILIPRNETMRKMMAAIEVHLAPDLKATRRVVLRETGGDYTDIRFNEQVIGLKMPPKTFDRNAPCPIEEVRRAATAKQSARSDTAGESPAAEHPHKVATLETGGPWYLGQLTTRLRPWKSNPSRERARAPSPSPQPSPSGRGGPQRCPEPFLTHWCLLTGLNSERGIVVASPRGIEQSKALSRCSLSPGERVRVRGNAIAQLASRYSIPKLAGCSNSRGTREVCL